MATRTQTEGVSGRTKATVVASAKFERIETISASLASDIAYPLIGSSTLAAQMYTIYQNKLKEARFVDATEGTPGAISSVTEPGGLQSDIFTAARL